MEKSDEIKIGIMLSHAGKEAREVYKMLLWAAKGDEKKFNKVITVFKLYCEPQKACCMNVMTFGAYTS